MVFRDSFHCFIITSLVTILCVDKLYNALELCTRLLKLNKRNWGGKHFGLLRHRTLKCKARLHSVRTNITIKRIHVKQTYTVSSTFFSQVRCLTFVMFVRDIYCRILVKVRTKPKQMYNWRYVCHAREQLASQSVLHARAYIHIRLADWWKICVELL